ncbi:MAG: hypothetical protein V2J25_14860 [Desulfatiglans sp.]|jgi:Fe-S-cluster-containing hydrogenase component 2|nr:4Fe-4S dicluster domain-containing protein [Thermodesulfobacteriota bacterium]MEE4354139.1 hypothetical protein [Desulfatiglans sp.]
MDNSRVEVDEEKCAGCLMCQLRCSFAFTGAFNPLEAYIYIEPPITGVRGISFSDECNECGLCTRVCAYGALRLKSE